MAICCCQSKRLSVSCFNIVFTLWITLVLLFELASSKKENGFIILVTSFAISSISSTLSCRNQRSLSLSPLPFLSAYLSTTRRLKQSMLLYNTKKATLTDETEWRIRFALRNIVTEQNNRVNEIFTIQGKFIEDDGYEPPQGVFLQSSSDDDSKRLRITSSRWKLSEDPNERKDGLWVWGLFQEPLYPFMLLQMETSSIPTNATPVTKSHTSSSTIIEKTKDVIKPLKLYAQMKHRRDSELGAIFDTVAELKVRQSETLNADPFGISKVDVYEEISVGTLSIQRVP